jgi:uncharacterized protein YyaL (SSP411 family)
VLNFNAQQINWISFSELALKMREEKKPIMIFIHTDWCKYCKMQEAITFSNDTLINELSENYYCVKFNGETIEDVVFLDKVYCFVQTGIGTGEHELVSFLANNKGEVTYPATIFFDYKFQLIKSFFGYHSVKEIKQL